MKKTILFICLAVSLLLNGCETTGLSLRENKTVNYPSYLYSLYDEEFTKGNIQVTLNPEIVLKLPITLAVAQVGEYGPPQGLMDYLKSQTILFKEVKGIPAISDTSSREATTETVKNQIHKMRRFAADLGMHYLFLYGGSIDFSDRSGAGTIVDWTLLGAYIIPTHEIKARGKASGALIDVEKGKVVFLVDAELSTKEMASTIQSNSKQDEVVEKLRIDVIERLGHNFIDKLSRRE